MTWERVGFPSLPLQLFPSGADLPAQLRGEVTHPALPARNSSPNPWALLTTQYCVIFRATREPRRSPKCQETSLSSSSRGIGKQQRWSQAAACDGPTTPSCWACGGVSISGDVPEPSGHNPVLRDDLARAGGLDQMSHCGPVQTDLSRDSMM